MLGNKNDSSNQLYFSMAVDISSLVPQDYILRLVDEAVDFSFIRQRVAHLYSPNMGRPSLDPEKALRMMVAMYLLNMSENRFFVELPMHVGYLWFCGFTLHEALPDRTTLVKTRKLWRNAGVFGDVMKEIVRQCVEAGLVKGDILAADGTVIRARASVKSLEEINPIPLDEYLSQVEKQDSKSDSSQDDSDQDDSGQFTSVDNEQKESSSSVKRRKSGDGNFRGEKFSNQTHRSTTDPEARLFRKSNGQEAKLSFLGHTIIDVRSGIILDAKATQANGALEREAALEMLEEARFFLLRSPEERCYFLGDGNYTAGDFLASVMELGYEPLVPMKNLRLEPVPTWKRRTNNLERFRKRKERIRVVRARNYTRLLNQTKTYRLTYRYRVRVEHIFAEAKEHHGLDKAKSYGLQAVDEQVKMTAVVQNIKRLATLCWRRKKRAAKTMELGKSIVAWVSQKLDQVTTSIFPSDSLLSLS